MENAVLDIKYATPPHRGEINLSSDTWLNDALRAILREILNVVAPSATPHSSARHGAHDLLRRVMANVCFITINYRPVSRIAERAPRVTATLANIEDFRSTIASPAPAPSPGGATFDAHLSAFTPSDIVFFDSRLRPVGELAPLAIEVRDSWRDTWAKYLGSSEKRDRFTINQLLLQYTAQPRPIFLSWSSGGTRQSTAPERFASESPARTLCDAALHFDTVGLSKIGRRARNIMVGAKPKADGDEDALDRFCAALRAMGVSAPSLEPDVQLFNVDRASVVHALIELNRHFSIWGGQSFFSIPTSIAIPSTETRDPYAAHNHVTAVVSVCMRPVWDSELHLAAWRFFSGIAHQVVTDLLVHENYMHKRMRWEQNRTNVIYKVTHPIKSQLMRTRKVVEQVDRSAQDVVDMADEIRLPTAYRERAIKLKAEAKRARVSAYRASNYFQLLNLLGDLMDEISVAPTIRDAVQESMRAPPGHPNGWLDLTDTLRSAARTATDKHLGQTGVNLSSGPMRAFIPRRFTRRPLMRHQAFESELIAAIFDELFENIATYGEKGPQNSVNAQLDIVQCGQVWAIDVYNAIGAHTLSRARESMPSTHEWAMPSSDGASGLSLVATFLRQLQLGTLRHQIVEGDQPLWRSQLVLTEQSHVR